MDLSAGILSDEGAKAISLPQLAGCVVVFVQVNTPREAQAHYVHYRGRRLPGTFPIGSRGVFNPFVLGGWAVGTVFESLLHWVGAPPDDADPAPTVTTAPKPPPLQIAKPKVKTAVKTAAVDAVVVHPDGDHIVTMTADGISLWNSDGYYKEKLEARNLTAKATTMATTHNGKRLAVGYADGRVGVWNTTYWGNSLMGIMDGKAAGPVRALGWRRDGSTLGIAVDRQVDSWDVDKKKRSGRCDFSRDNPALWVFSSDGEHVMTTEGHRGVISSVVNNVAEDTVGDALYGSIIAARFSPDDSFLALAYTTGRVQIWRRVEGHKFYIATDRVIESGHQRPIQAVAFSANGEVLVTGGDTELRFWHTKTGQHLLTLGGFRNPVRSFCPYNRSRYLAVNSPLDKGSDDGFCVLDFGNDNFGLKSTKG